MSRSLRLPDELFNKLAQGAAQRGLTIEALLGFVSELVATPDQPTERDRERSRGIERLLAKYRAGPLTHEDRADLDRLIDLDYREAVARADEEVRIAVVVATYDRDERTIRHGRRDFRGPHCR